MTDSRAELSPDRLPWLNDERTSAPESPTSWRFPWLTMIGGLTILAAASYWIGQRSVNLVPREATTPIPARAGPSEKPAGEVPTVSPPGAPAPAPPHPPPHQSRPAQVGKSPAAPESGPTPLSATTSSPRLWSAWDSAGARGRMIRVGAYSSIYEAKLGWRRMVEAKPALASLPATVVGVRNSRGVHLYRLQIGTSSQAHSEVLCQRVRQIDLSCAVIGLPVKPEGVER